MPAPEVSPPGCMPESSHGEFENGHAWALPLDSALLIMTGSRAWTLC